MRYGNTTQPGLWDIRRQREIIDMAFNPMVLLKAKERLKLFKEEHPRVLPFFKSIREDIEPGAVIEMKVTSVNGKETVTNIRLTEEDVETIQMFRKQFGSN